MGVAFVSTAIIAVTVGAIVVSTDRVFLAHGGFCDVTHKCKDGLVGGDEPYVVIEKTIRQESKGTFVVPVF